MKKFAASLLVVFAGLAGATTALAQYTGPTAGAKPAASAPAGYSGPSSVPLITVKQLLEHGKDDQHARLQGNIVSHDGGKNYTFADASGRMPVEISAKRFPADKPIGAEQRVELIGEVDKDFRKMEFEVDELRLVN